MNALAVQRSFAVFLSVVLSFAPAMASARDCRPHLRDGWVRMPPGKMPTMAGFGRIVNPCPMPAKIVSARSPSFGSVALHETRSIDGVGRMRPVPELRVVPDGSALLKPGGLHLMLMRPSVELKAGSRIVVEFVLADGGTVFGEFEIRKPSP